MQTDPHTKLVKLWIAESRVCATHIYLLAEVMGLPDKIYSLMLNIDISEKYGLIPIHVFGALIYMSFPVLDKQIAELKQQLSLLTPRLEFTSQLQDVAQVSIKKYTYRMND